ncbi:MAG TPA: hypothetical protein VGV67_10550 [Solirubrobacteraceae bacterium]|nr:hypothetical protein [Solirubrobacteraceae bacterium]
MTAGARVAAFGVLLVAIFALAALAGRAVGPAADDDERAQHGAPAAHGDSLRLAAGDTTLTPGRPARLDFAVMDAQGDRVRDFDVEQGRRMHLIVVRRDLRRFAHLHPTEVAPGAWTATITLPDAGVYHAFADFQTSGERRTLGVDLFAAGDFEPLALPDAGSTARTDGYDVALREGERAGELRFAVSRDGAPVEDLQDYLAAKGHLVMLRAGDLAYEHVHPLEDDALAFDAGGAEPGTYRLFLQFRHRDAVHTAAFTREVAP